MIEVKSNESRRNVAKDGLAGIKLLSHSIFYGVNGAGKSTVCELLAQTATFSDDRPAEAGPLKVFAFDDQWRRETVGEFIEGGSAEGVVTVKLNNGAGALEKSIQDAQAAWDAAKSNVETIVKAKQSAEERRKDIVDRVAGGIRKSFENDCPSLGGRQFNRLAISRFLEDGHSNILSANEVEEQLAIATSPTPEPLPNLPALPIAWMFSDQLWTEVTSTPPTTRDPDLTITDWIREGMKNHTAGESCHFCTGLVTAERMKILEEAAQRVEREASPLVKRELEECRQTARALDKFRNVLEAVDLNRSIYSADLHMKKVEVLLDTERLLTQIKNAQEILEGRVRNPQYQAQGKKPDITFSSLEEKYTALSQSHSTARTKTARHLHNREKAVEMLKRHCCAVDGSGWDNATQMLAGIEKDLEDAAEKESTTKSALDELKKQISTTADTAEFLDNGLAQILGERTLRVTEGGPSEGYRITRYGQRADGMSEGEKKLVALLYSCAQFRAEDRKQILSDSIIIFDDLGAELDEPRLLAIDDFISHHFQDPAPASLVYFTHSHTYLRILQSRLGKYASESYSKGKLVPPRSIFYEVYKDSFSKGNQSTTYRQWDSEAITLTNDYWLSFYKVIQAFEDLQDGRAPRLGTGNYCRKTLEGFTEFRVPGTDLLRNRIDDLLRNSSRTLSSSLSKIVHGLSHSNLSKAGGVLSSNEVERAVIQTLQLVNEVDEDHFSSLLIKFRGKKGTREIKEALRRRIDSQMVSQVPD